MSNELKEWIVDAGKRAAKTVAQGAVTLIGSDMVSIISLDWGYILGACATMGVVSILMSVASIPVGDKNAKSEQE